MYDQFVIFNNFSRPSHTMFKDRQRKVYLQQWITDNKPL